MGRRCDGKEKSRNYYKDFLAKSLGSTKRGRPRLHWRDEVDEDARMFRIKKK